MKKVSVKLASRYASDSETLISAKFIFDFADITQKFVIWCGVRMAFYGLPEAELHWYNIMHRIFKEKMLIIIIEIVITKGKSTVCIIKT